MDILKNKSKNEHAAQNFTIIIVNQICPRKLFKLVIIYRNVEDEYCIQNITLLLVII